MRRIRILVLVLLAALVAMPTSAEARKRFSPKKFVYTVTAPLRIVTGIPGRRVAHRARHHRKAALHRHRKAAVYRQRKQAAARAAAAAATPPAAAAAAVSDAPPLPEVAATDARGPAPAPGPERRPERRPSREWMAASAWLGPLYWPHASDDLFDYVFQPSRAGDWFWARGASDLFDAIFMRAADTKAQWGEMCASRRGGSHVWIEPIMAAVEPNAGQLQALNTLRDTLVKAGNEVRGACPAPGTTATPGQRLDAMTDRLWALRQAVITMRAPLEGFVSALTGNQQARLNAITHQTVGRPVTGGAGAQGGSPAQVCGASAAASGEWPAEEIEQRVRPVDEQRQALEALRMTTLGMAQTLMTSCPTETPATPMERLEAAEKRLNALLDAARTVAPAAHGFYNALVDEQKAAFRSLGRRIGPMRQSLDAPELRRGQ
jgi:hypothetical protein